MMLDSRFSVTTHLPIGKSVGITKPQKKKKKMYLEEQMKYNPVVKSLASKDRQT